MDALSLGTINGIRTWSYEGGYKLRELPNLQIFFLTIPKEKSDLCEGRHFSTKAEAEAFIHQRELKKATEQKEFWWLK